MAEHATRTATQGPRGFAGFFSTEGRVGPARFALVLIAAYLCWRATLLVFDRGGVIAYTFTGAASGTVLAKVVAEAGRRLHDTGRGGWFGVLVGAALAIPLVAITPSELAYDPPWLFPAMAAVAGLIAAAVMFRPATPGADRWGGRPAGPLAHAPGRAGPSARPIAWTVISVLGGALFAFGLVSISEGMREQNEEDQRRVEQRGGR